MAVIHQTTLSPTKLGLLTAWLPAQPWYIGTGHPPDLVRAGGFRLDDPRGEVGIEFMAVTDRSGDRARTYHVPMTYRGSALEGAGDGLVGTAEHGVLGRRWIYDGAADPVLAVQLVALIQGEAQAQAQAQSVSDTADMTVVSTPVTAVRVTVAGPPVLARQGTGTEILMPVSTAGGGVQEFVVRVSRLLVPAAGPAGPGEGRGSVSATWHLADGTQAHGTFATARILPVP